MKMKELAKTTWISGEVCRQAGRYYSESCNHELEQEFWANDIFPHCHFCQKIVRWERMGAPNESNSARAFFFK